MFVGRVPNRTAAGQSAGGERIVVADAKEAVPDPRPLSPSERVALLDEAYNEVMIHNGGTYWLSSGPETQMLWDATLDSFAHGIWVATIVCAQATCERTFASLVHTWYTIRPEPKGWRRWGLGQLIDHLAAERMVDDALLADARILCEARKPYGHWRGPMEDGSLEKVAYDAYVRGDQTTWDETQQLHVAQLAFMCARTALRIHFGDLLRYLGK